MRPAVCVLLLSGLLAGLAEGYSVGFTPQVISVQEPQKAWVEDDKSFIADEDTEEGKLWSSDEDPDWEPSESQEDESVYDQIYEDYSEEDDQTYEDSSEEDDQTYEDYSEEDDQTNEDSSEEDDQIYDDYLVEDDQTEENGPQQDDYGQDPFPLPDEFVPLQLNDWYQSQQEKKKRDVQSHYQTSQVVQVPAAYDIDPYRPGVSVGVEPLLPVDGPTQQEVGVGIEPVLEDKEEESGGSSVGGWFREGWRRFTGGVEDTVEHIGDKLHETFQGLREKVASIVGRFKVLMRKFGILIQEGVSYCLRRFKHSSDQLQESVVFEKLEKKLEQGHAEVAQFFQILGQKIKNWREQQTSTNIDAGLIEGHTQQERDQQEQDQQEGQYSQDIEQNMPDFFQDLEVQDQLNKLREEGVLNQNDIIILTQDHIYQDQQNQQDQEQNGDYGTQQQNQQQNQQEQSQFDPTFIRFPH